MLPSAPCFSSQALSNFPQRQWVRCLSLCRSRGHQPRLLDQSCGGGASQDPTLGPAVKLGGITQLVTATLPLGARSWPAGALGRLCLGEPSSEGWLFYHILLINYIIALLVFLMYCHNRLTFDSCFWSYNRNNTVLQADIVHRSLVSVSSAPMENVLLVAVALLNLSPAKCPFKGPGAVHSR